LIVEALMATKKKAADESLDKQIAVRLTEADYKRLEALSSRVPVSAIARVALMVGIEAIEKQPGILIGEKPRK